MRTSSGGTTRLLAAVAMIVSVGACARPAPAPLAIEEKFTKWTRYEAEPGATHYSALDQINTSNVQQLQVAWTYENGFTGYNPIIIDSVMYVIGRGGTLAALHAGTGREIWSIMPRGPLPNRNRGVMYWENADRSDRRLFITRANVLSAYDATTGRAITSFGTNGERDVREGIARDPAGINANPSSPGVIFENLIILGSGTGEAYGSGPGDIRAFDAVTGKLVWVFHTIPHPGEFGYETWPADAYQRVGGANVWGGMSVDEKRGIVYLPIGSATYDFYGADRIGSNVFANSLVALDARTGKRIWHYQTVHHDLWDYDLTATPTLLTIRQNGKPRDIVAQATKQGYLFVFDRVTGDSIWPIDERAVPASDMPGEKAWPTQPTPRWPRPFAVQSFGMDDVNPFLPQAEQDSVRRRLGQILNLQETVFQPPSTRPTMQMPGNSGGANWGSTAADPTDGSFYVITKNLPTILTLERIVPGVFGTGTSQADRGQFAYQQNCQACHQANRQGQPPMIPSLVGVTDRLTPDEIRAVVHEGKGNMPAFRDMPAQEVNSLITYLTNPGLASPPQTTSAMAASEGDSGPMRFQTGYGYFSASGGMYARKPPFTTMTKYDLNTGIIRWQIPIGDVPSLTARGIADATGQNTLRGGPAVTAGGLIFVITRDKLRAYDKSTGSELWTGQLPANGDGIPAVYEVDGRQYVVVGVSAGGGGFNQAAAAPGAPLPVMAYVAFALPRGIAGR